MVTVRMSAEQFAAKRSQLEGQGVVFTAATSQGLQSGTAKGDGVLVTYSFDQAAGVLSCYVMKKPPLLVPLSVAESKLRSWLAL